MMANEIGVTGADDLSSVQDRLLNHHPIRLRSDQLFVEVRATLANSFLDLIQHNRHTLFERLQSETGVRCDEDKENNCTLRGQLDQIILAKLKLETFLLDFQDALLQGRSPLGGAECDSNDILRSSINVQSLTTSGPKIKIECEDDEEEDSPLLNSLPLNQSGPFFGPSKKAKLSPGSLATPASHHSPILASLIGLKSRRKVGRPRKIDSIVGTSNNSLGLLRELGVQGRLTDTTNLNSAVNLQDYRSDLDSRSVNGESSGTRELRTNVSGNGRTLMEQQAERKATEWLSNLDSSCLMDTSNDDEKEKEDSQFEYCCELCSFKATREGQFLKHVLIHGKQDTVHKCDKCSFASVSLNHVNRHRLSHSDSIFKCPQCSFLTDDAKQLARHVTLKHTMMADSMPKGSGMLQCNDCAYQTTKIYHFERHLLVHNRDLKGLLQVYHCDQCPYRTHRKEHFLRHRDNVHLRNRPYQCSACSRSYKREDALQQHQITVHGIYPPLLDPTLSLADLALPIMSDEPGSPPTDSRELLPSVTNTNSGASISIIPANGSSNSSRTTRGTLSGSTGGIPSLIAGALTANHGDGAAMPRTSDVSSSSKWGSALPAIVSSVSITPTAATSSVHDRPNTLEKVSISISPLGQLSGRTEVLLTGVMADH